MRTWSVFALAIGVGVGSAQVTSSPNTFSARFGPPQPLPDKPIANEPYSGERMRDEAWTGAAGVHSSSWLASQEYRDSAGRTLRRIAGFENVFAVGSEQFKESRGIVM